MSEQAPTIYQSGQTVDISGTYEVIGSKRRTKTATGEFAVRELAVGDVFPNYEGRSVAWHLLSTTAQFSLASTEPPQHAALGS
jgi:hypothetical protein